MSAVPAGFDPLSGRVDGVLWPVEAWEEDRAAQDAAYAELRESWEVPHTPAAQRILQTLAEGWT